MTDHLLFLGPIGGPELIMILLVLLILGAPALIVLFVLKATQKPSQPSISVPPPIPQQSVQDRLRTIDGLKGNGLISDSEYEEKRKELLKEL